MIEWTSVGYEEELAEREQALGGALKEAKDAAACARPPRVRAEASEAWDITPSHLATRC